MNREIIAEFRANGGKLGGPFANIDVLLLTTGTRTVPLGYARDGARLIVFAGDDGRERGPNWYHDLMADPRAEVEVGSDSWSVRATEATGEERNRIWDGQIQRWGFLKDLQAKVSWDIPVLILTAV